MWCPLYKWGQTRDKVVVTVFVPCVRDDAVTIEITPGAVKLEKEGQATARFASANVATRALAALNHQYCGSRYVDLSFAAKP